VARSKEERLISEAEAQLNRGRFSRALSIFQKAVAADPASPRLLQRVADLQLRLNRPAAALATYCALSKVYIAAEYHQKAIAVLEKILRLDPTNVETHRSLADLQMKQGRRADALNSFRAAARLYLEQGNPAQYIESLNFILELDPTNAEATVRLAEHMLSVGRHVTGVDLLDVAARDLFRAGKLEKYVAVAERYLHYRPDDWDRLKQLATTYIVLRQYRRALEKSQLLFHADPDAIEVLTLIVRALQGLGKTEAQIRALKHLARLQHKVRRDNAARESWERIIDLNPDEAEANVALERTVLPGDSHDWPGALNTSDLRNSLNLIPKGHEPVDPKVLQSVDVDEILCEADKYIRNGQFSGAHAAIERILDIDPHNIAAMERAVRVALTEGNLDGSVDRLLEMAATVRDSNREKAVGFLEHALKLAPGHPEATALAAELSSIK
jgi:tetratricopeptide (TPR) repeat protein